MVKELVSVIIPTYNRKHTIRRSIDSVLAQTYRAFEIIIIDDCSTDGTMEYVHELYGDITDVNIIYVKNDNNIGPGASRNIGVSYASGEYIAFHDSDDEWLPHKLEKQMEAMLCAFDFVLGEALQYGNQQVFFQSVLELSQDEDYLQYAKEKCGLI